MSGVNLASESADLCAESAERCRQVGAAKMYAKTIDIMWVDITLVKTF